MTIYRFINNSFRMSKRFYNPFNYRSYSRFSFLNKNSYNIIIFLPIAFVSTIYCTSKRIQFYNASCNTYSSDSEEFSEVTDLVIFQADKLFDDNDFSTLLKYLEDFEDCGEPEIIWRFSRACYKVATLSYTDIDTAKMLSYKAYELSKRATLLQPDNFASHKWAGITLSHIGSYESLTNKILQAYEVKDYFDKAISLFPNDPTSWHLLGQWCFTIASITWIERRIISHILAVPPVSTFEDALSCFRRAEIIEPGFYSVNTLFLGKTCLKTKNIKEAVKWLNLLLLYESKNEEDQKAIEEAKILLNNLPAGN